MRKLFYFIICTCVILLSCKKEESISLSGVVRNYITKETIDSCEVFIYDKKPFLSLISCKGVSEDTLTDTNGKFAIDFTTECAPYLRLNLYNQNGNNKMPSYRLIINGFPDSLYAIAREGFDYDEFHIKQSEKNLQIEAQPSLYLVLKAIDEDSLSLEYIDIPEFGLKIDTFTSKELRFYLFLKRFEGNFEIRIKHQNKALVKQKIDYQYFKEHYYSIEIKV